MRGSVAQCSVLVLAAVLLVACGAVSSAAPEHSGPRGLLASRPGAVFYLQWTENSGALVGSLRTVSASPDGRSTTTATSNFSGLASGDTFTINFPSESDLGSWSGTLSGDGASVQVTAPGGTIESVEFTNATDADYNATVARLQEATQQLDSAAARVATAESVAAGLLSAYTKALFEARLWNNWSEGYIESEMEYFWDALQRGDRPHARQIYRSVRGLLADSSLDDMRENRLYLGSGTLTNARKACESLASGSAPVIAAIDDLAETIETLRGEMGITFSPIDVAPAQDTAAKVASAAQSCQSEINRIIPAFEKAFKVTKAAYVKMVKKAKSLGW